MATDVEKWQRRQVTKTLRKDLPRACQICQFKRLIECCHILPHRYGGPLVFENLLALCPNHHKLFDRFMLTREEFALIEGKIEIAMGLYKGRVADRYFGRLLRVL